MIRYKFCLLVLLASISTSAYAQDDFIAPELAGEDLITFLQENYSVTNQQSYNAARDAMFEEIDGPNGIITCVYTGYSIQFTDRSDAQGSQAANDFNTEHAWPQSFFDSELPMRSDIHHLFPTRVDVNGARSNFKFDEIDDDETDSWWRSGDIGRSSIPVSNIDEYSELLNGSAFEPREDLKGNIARAIFYFWTIYQNDSDIINDGTDNEAFFESMQNVLLEWHSEDPVDSVEVARSLQIEMVQGNRNPFIHDTTLVERAYFGRMPITSNEVDDKIIGFDLKQNYPNPFNPTTTITFTLKSAGNVSITVYQSNGVEITTLLNEFKNSGEHALQFDASSLASGLYFYRMEMDGYSLTRKMTLLK